MTYRQQMKRIWSGSADAFTLFVGTCDTDWPIRMSIPNSVQWYETRDGCVTGAFRGGLYVDDFEYYSPRGGV